MMCHITSIVRNKNGVLLMLPCSKKKKKLTNFFDCATSNISVCSINCFYCWQNLTCKRAIKSPRECVYGQSIFSTSHVVAVPHHHFFSFYSQRNKQIFLLQCQVHFPQPVFSFAYNNVYPSFSYLKNLRRTCKQTSEWPLPVRYYQTAEFQAKCGYTI